MNGQEIIIQNLFCTIRLLWYQSFSCKDNQLFIFCKTSRNLSERNSSLSCAANRSRICPQKIPGKPSIFSICEIWSLWPTCDQPSCSWETQSCVSEAHRSRICNLDFNQISDLWLLTAEGLLSRYTKPWPTCDHHDIFKKLYSYGRPSLLIILVIFSTFFQDQRYAFGPHL